MTIQFDWNRHGPTDPVQAAYRPIVELRRWDEADHPRDRKGRFTRRTERFTHGQRVRVPLAAANAVGRVISENGAPDPAGYLQVDLGQQGKYQVLASHLVPMETREKARQRRRLSAGAGVGAQAALVGAQAALVGAGFLAHRRLENGRRDQIGPGPAPMRVPSTRLR